MVGVRRTQFWPLATSRPSWRRTISIVIFLTINLISAASELNPCLRGKIPDTVFEFCPCGMVMHDRLK